MENHQFQVFVYWLVVSILCVASTQSLAQDDCKEKSSELDLVFIVDSSGSIRPGYQTAEEIRARFDNNPSFEFFRKYKPDMYNKVVEQAIKDTHAGPDNWQIQQDFIKNIVDSLEVGSDDVRVGMVVFSADYQHEFFLKDYSKKEDVLNAIDRDHFLGQSTNTQSALVYARSTLFQAENGDRANVPNVAIVITDGQSNSPSNGKSNTEATVLEAAKLHGQDVRVISVGITGNVNDEEVRLISSPPHEENVDWFEVDDFDDLVDRLDDLIQVVKKTCPKKGCVPDECVFPFEYRGHTFTECTTKYIPSGKPWCADVPNFNNVPRPHTHFKYCICNTL